MLEKYQKEIDFIFNQFPSYQKVGKIAYKPGIQTMQEMDALLGYPHRQFKSIHIAGTNGKGSTSHMIASALMRMGLRVGLYTSPHLIDFRERMKVNGEMVCKEFVYDFILKYKSLFLDKKASFFEITTAMAFAWFAEQKVDIAVIECGLGGRLDSTNIITPVLSVITNIGLDHCEYLGYTYREVAVEKAGIIKPGVPVVIGERGEMRGGEVPGGGMPGGEIRDGRMRGGEVSDSEMQVWECSMADGIPASSGSVTPDEILVSDWSVAEVFEAVAARCGSMLFFAEDLPETHPLWLRVNRAEMDLQGFCQDKNLKTVCAALEVLCAGSEVDFSRKCTQFAAGIEQAARDTGLRGRWEKLREEPLVICDTGHNAHGFMLLGKQIRKTLIEQRAKRLKSRLFMVFGVVADKDLHAIQSFLPGRAEQAYYLYVNAEGTRALPAEELAQKMELMGFNGEVAGSVSSGLDRALQLALPEDFIFIGGSTFVVAEILR